MSSTSIQLERVRYGLQRLQSAAEQFVTGIEMLLGEVEVGETIENGESMSAVESPCETCSKYATCKEPCDELLSLLPPEDAGRSRHVSTVSMPLEVLEHDHILQRPDHLDLLDRFRKCRTRLSPKRWQVVELVHGEGLSQTEAARRLGKSKSTVSELLKEATAKLEAFEAQEST